MHNAAMKAVYVKESDVPKNVIDEILAGEDGKKALKKFIKRDVLYEHEFALAEKPMSVAKFMKSTGRQWNTELTVE